MVLHRDGSFICVAGWNVGMADILVVPGCPDIDIVDLLKNHGYGVVEGADEVRKKIKEIGNEGRTDNRRLQQSCRGKNVS